MTESADVVYSTALSVLFSLLGTTRRQQDAVQCMMMACFRAKILMASEGAGRRMDEIEKRDSPATGHERSSLLAKRGRTTAQATTS